VKCAARSPASAGQRTGAASSGQQLGLGGCKAGGFLAPMMQLKYQQASAIPTMQAIKCKTRGQPSLRGAGR